ncbi:MAG: helix-turn-helix domain-containing protein [Patescibacteria group bacterium]|jgi:sugar-specific transcriptional regulator TrmB
MSDQTDNAIALLKPFGLSTEEAQIYLDLLEKKSATALSISRSIHIGRTKVYRILDKLIEKRLVLQKFETAGFKFIANSPSQFDLLLAEKERELVALKSSLPKTVQTLEQYVGSNKPGSQILFYRGERGLSQVNWNLLHAKHELLSYEVATADAYMPQKEAEELRKGLVENKIFIRSLTNSKIVKPFTNVLELIAHWCELRHLSPSVLTITQDIFIYNNVYAVCNYLDDGDIFCFEIYNSHLATMQKEIFENLWNQGKKMLLLDKHGSCALSK